MKRILCAPLLALLFVACGTQSEDTNPSDPDFTIGVLLDQSGDTSQSSYLLENALFEAAKAAQETYGVAIALEVRDTQGDPSGASAAFQELVDLGIRVFIGPDTSGEAQAVLPLANAVGALLVSPSSTAQSLAIPNDALYRLSPTNLVEATASLNLMQSQGKRSLVTVNRDDLGNGESVSAMRSAAGRAGFALQPPITYPQSFDSTSSFTDVAEQVAASVSAAAGAGSTEPVVVYASGYDEIDDLFADMRSINSLQGVATYGSSSVSQQYLVVSSAGPAFFGVEADNLPSPLLSVPSDRQAEAQQITQEIGGTNPNAFVLNGYDGVLMMAKAYLNDPTFASGGSASRQAFVKAADGYPGLTGITFLNAAGDRISGRYTFWGVCSLQGLINWYPIGAWNPSSPTSTQGSIEFYGCPTA